MTMTERALAPAPVDVDPELFIETAEPAIDTELALVPTPEADADNANYHYVSLAEIGAQLAETLIDDLEALQAQSKEVRDDIGRRHNFYSLVIDRQRFLNEKLAELVPHRSLLAAQRQELIGETRKIHEALRGHGIVLTTGLERVAIDKLFIGNRQEEQTITLAEKAVADKRDDQLGQQYNEAEEAKDIAEVERLWSLLGTNQPGRLTTHIAQLEKQIVQRREQLKGTQTQNAQVCEAIDRQTWAVGNLRLKNTQVISDEEKAEQLLKHTLQQLGQAANLLQRHTLALHTRLELPHQGFIDDFMGVESEGFVPLPPADPKLAIAENPDQTKQLTSGNAQSDIQQQASPELVLEAEVSNKTPLSRLSSRLLQSINTVRT